MTPDRNLIKPSYSDWCLNVFQTLSKPSYSIWCLIVFLKASHSDKAMSCSSFISLHFLGGELHVHGTLQSTCKFQKDVTQQAAA